MIGTKSIHSSSVTMDLSRLTMDLSDVTMNFRNGILTKKAMLSNEKLDVHAYRTHTSYAKHTHSAHKTYTSRSQNMHILSTKYALPIQKHLFTPFFLSHLQIPSNVKIYQ